MSKITKLHKYSVHWLIHQGWDTKDISKELKLTTDQINKILDVKVEKTESQSSEIVSQKITPAKDLMITHTSGKKINSVAIMTKEASEIGDTNRNTSKMSDKTLKGIFRPKK